jgi:hypothetical protein
MVVGIDEAEIAKASGNVATELVPSCGKEPPGVNRQPIDLGTCPGTDCAGHHGRHSLGVTLGVGESQDRTPGKAEDDPTVDTEVLSELFDVSNVVVHVDRIPMHSVVGGMRCAPSCGSLVEQHGPVTPFVEDGPGARRTSRSGSSVEIHDRSSIGVTDLLIEQDVAVSDVETPDIERSSDGCRHTTSLPSGDHDE